MPFSGHWVELIIILLIALIVFGPERLPEFTSSLGRAMREFRRATSELEDAVMHHVDAEQEAETAEPEPFPHVPPAPDSGEEAQVTPTIDTLAQRREARQRAKQVPQQPPQQNESDEPQSAS